MRMIVGGAAQGKWNYAKKTYPAKSWADGRDCLLEEIQKAEGIYHFEAWVKRKLQVLWMEEGRERPEIDRLAEELALGIWNQNPNLLLITDEIGCGIVPMEPFDRDWRELHGRICTLLAEKSESLERVICGIPLKLK